ncbi:MAG TPA: hypothetical protein VJA21_14830 [Verrucomicrobiae bacterium]
MASLNELKRRSILPLAALGLAAYYLLVFVPLAHKAGSLDDELKKSWQRLAASVEQTNAARLDFAQITNQLSETRHQLVLLEEAKKKVSTHLELSPDLRSKLSAPFQLVDYQNERSKQIDELDSQTKQQKVALDPVVYAGFPEHTADMAEPSLLWAALSLTTDLLQTALRCKVAAIHSLEVAVAPTNSIAPEVAAPWAEIALQLEFTAAADNAVHVVQSLPLTAEEIRAAGLPAPERQKAPLFIDRFIIRKETPDKLDEVRVWVRATGFVLRE